MVKNNKIDNNFLPDVRKFKPDLRFELGDVVYHKSDWDKKTPMVIDAVFPNSEEADYRCVWLTSQKNMESLVCFDKSLCV